MLYTFPVRLWTLEFRLLFADDPRVDGFEANKPSSVTYMLPGQSEDYLDPVVALEAIYVRALDQLERRLAPSGYLTTMLCADLIAAQSTLARNTSVQNWMTTVGPANAVRLEFVSDRVVMSTDTQKYVNSLGMITQFIY